MERRGRPIRVYSHPTVSAGATILALPGVNKKGKVSTAGSNYIWIRYFHSYLSEPGRVDFVMSSQASGFISRSRLNLADRARID